MPSSSPLSVAVAELPNGWKLKPLGAVCSSAQYGLSEPACETEGNARMVGMRHLNGGIVSFKDMAPVDVSDKDLESCRLCPDDILFNRTNSFELVGKTAIVGKDVPPNIVFASYLVRLHVDPELACAKYVCLLLNSELGRRQLHALITPGVSQFNINPTELLKRVRLPFPSPDVQQSIVSAIEAVEDAASCLNRLISKKQDFRRGLTQQLLTGKHRFLEFGQACANGAYPTDWEHPHAGEVFARVSIKGNGKEPVLSVTQDVGIVRRDSLERRIEASSDNLSSYKLVEPGDFVISLRSFQGGLEYSSIRGIVSPAYHVIRPKRPVVDDFYRHYFKSYEFIGRLAISVIGIRDGKQVNFDDFAFIRVPYPSIEEQQRIADILNTCDSEISLLCQQRDALRAQKKGLIQQLLTGKVRVPALTP